MNGHAAAAPLPPLDVRPLFRPLLDDLLALLGALAPEEWARPASRSWSVREVAAHLLDGDCRQLSFGRDGLPLLPPERPIAGPDDFLAFLDGLNGSWVEATRRLSPALLVELLALTGRRVADYFEASSLDSQALFAVAWAGQSSSPNWLHLARELTERWHHQQQIRRATGRSPLADPRFAGPVLETFLYSLPPAYAETPAPPGTAVEIRFEAPVAQSYALVRTESGWRLAAPATKSAARIAFEPIAAWEALSRSVPVATSRERAALSGPEALTEPFFRACAIHKRPL
ncbi:MAG: maleylpyruvate isomerase N-terminal domain-containing protein [Thermoanaerobaculia bacterium]